MKTGTILNVEHAPGVGSIQPHDGSELAFFNHQDLNEQVQPNDQVSFETARSIPGAQGIQAENVRVVKSS